MMCLWDKQVITSYYWELMGDWVTTIDTFIVPNTSVVGVVVDYVGCDDTADGICITYLKLEGRGFLA